MDPSPGYGLGTPRRARVPVLREGESLRRAEVSGGHYAGLRLRWPTSDRSSQAPCPRRGAIGGLAGERPGAEVATVSASAPTRPVGSRQPPPRTLAIRCGAPGSASFLPSGPAWPSTVRVWPSARSRSGPSRQGDLPTGAARPRRDQPVDRARVERQLPAEGGARPRTKLTVTGPALLRSVRPRAPRSGPVRPSGRSTAAGR
jgi:hypothetical protein